MNKIYRNIQITKIDEDQRMVYGYASTPDLDKDGEVIETSALEKSLPEYMKFPTIREMHQPKPIGVTKETRLDPGKGLFIGAKIVDNDAWMKVKEGVYKAFSVGGRVIKRVKNIIKELELVEISLVDVPANPAAVITLYKQADSKHIERLLNMPASDERNKALLKYGIDLYKSNSLEERNKRLLSKYAYKLHEDKPMADNKELQKADEVVEETTEETTDEVVENTTKADEVVEENTADAEVEATEEVVENDEPEKSEEVEYVKADDVSNLVKAAEDKQAEVVSNLLAKIESLESRMRELENMPAEPKTKASFVAQPEVSDTDHADSRMVEIDKRLAELAEMRENDLQKYQLGNYQVEAMKLLNEKRLLS